MCDCIWSLSQVGFRKGGVDILGRRTQLEVLLSVLLLAALLALLACLLVLGLGLSSGNDTKHTCLPLILLYLLISFFISFFSSLPHLLLSPSSLLPLSRSSFFTSSHPLSLLLFFATSSLASLPPYFLPFPCTPSFLSFLSLPV